MQGITIERIAGVHQLGWSLNDRWPAQFGENTCE
jgi:hypothetical protein